MLFPNANNWRAGMQDVAAAVEDAMGELVTVTPIKASKPNSQSEPDEARAVTAIAVFTSKASTAFGPTRQAGGVEIAPMIDTREPIFQFALNAVPFPLARGYFIHRCCSGETFEVTRVKPDGVASIVCHVVQFGRFQKGAWK
jgi:hypothetical protein